MKKPWYIWLSIIAFLIIFQHCKDLILHKNEKMDYNLWFRFLGKVFFLWVLVLMVPAGLMLFLMDFASESNYFLGTIINVAILVYLYFGGVIISGKLYDWKIENIK